MAVGVDTSKWKPRRVRGTPSHIVRNRIAYGVLGFAAICGVGFHFLSFTENLRKATDALISDPEGEIERKQFIFSMMHNRTGDQIRQLMEEEKNPSLPYK